MALNTTATASNSSERKRSNSPIRKYFSPKPTNDSPSSSTPSSSTPKKPLTAQNENDNNAILNKTKKTQQARFLDSVKSRKSQSLTRQSSVQIDEKPKPPTLKRSHSAISSLDTANTPWMRTPVKSQKKTDNTYDRLTPVITDMPSAQLMMKDSNSESQNKRFAEALGLPRKERILAYKIPPPTPKIPDIAKNASQPQLNTHTSARTKRRIAETPEKILDAPYLVNDYYLNLLDWSKNNQVAIGLNNAIYIWNADNGSISSLNYTSDDQVTSLAWSSISDTLTVGTANGEAQLWDINKNVKIRSLRGQDCRIGVLNWNHNYICSTGARDGSIWNHDVRQKASATKLIGHTSEVCGLKWRRDGQLLASGGNDNTVNIWDARQVDKPKYQKRDHKGAIKALAWCPWNPNLLATGGGRDDKQIIFWNTYAGNRVKTIQTQAQVTSLTWSHHYKEIVSTHGMPHNHITVWGYDEGNKIIDIPAHDSRILHSALSPDGQTLATAAADENLKFWKIFESNGNPRIADQRGLHTKGKPSLSRQRSIR